MPLRYGFLFFHLYNPVFAVKVFTGLCNTPDCHNKNMKGFIDKKAKATMSALPGPWCPTEDIMFAHFSFG